MMDFTTKQIAELLEVSKPTVQKKINVLEIKPERKENNNRDYYSYADTVTIIRKIKPNFDFSVLTELVEKPQSDTAKPQNEPQSTEKPQSFAPNLDEETAKPQNDTLELLKRTISIIEEQLEEKNKQIAVKDKQIQDLSDRLAEAMQLTKGQQYIAAADKTTELLEAADNKKDAPEDPAIVVNEVYEEVEVEEENPSSSEQINETEEPIPQKKGFWKRLFGE